MADVMPVAPPLLAVPISAREKPWHASGRGVRVAVVVAMVVAARSSQPWRTHMYMMLTRVRTRLGWGTNNPYVRHAKRVADETIKIGDARCVALPLGRPSMCVPLPLRVRPPR